MTHVSERAPRVSDNLTTSLWRCDVCATFVSIHSPQIIASVTCPTCMTGRLSFCGSFEQILGLAETDA
jgi:rubrerythrin